ncbi:hypothetical protein WJX75_004862 [Coccomyxa subellipsoidea]|uniref:UspA domain-containing protein n=1 Tax=Coccomyxa subellipsoidea TaxID=248742 RepID=A0ABR2YGT0_9CHLO
MASVSASTSAHASCSRSFVQQATGSIRSLSRFRNDLNVAKTCRNSGVEGFPLYSRRGDLPSGRRVNCSASVQAAAGGLKYDHLLLAIMDNNPYFSDGSKQAFATAAGLGLAHNSKMTVLLVDEAQPGGDASTRIETALWHLKENGFDTGNAAFQEVSLAAEETHNSSVVVGNAVDQVEADLVLLSTEAVHSKAVDANLLAEFVDCPVLLLP